MSDIQSKSGDLKSRFLWLNSTKSEGFTILEVVVTIFVIGTAVTGLLGLFLLTFRTSQGNEHRVVAVALGNEKMEMIRNLPYDSVGTAGGIPSGGMPQEEVIERNGVPYTVKTNIGYIDDPYDGTGEDDPINADYKQVRIEVIWPHPNEINPVRLVTTVAPPGVEGGEVAGTLALQILNANGVGLSGVTVKLVNSTVDPPVDYETQANDEGKLVVPGLKESVEGYKLEVSKPGYTTKKTFDETADFFPNSEFTHLTAMPGDLTEKTFSIDIVSTLSLSFVDEDGAAIPDVAHRMRGSKTLGLDADEETVYAVDITQNADAEGLSTHDYLEWDDYYVIVDGEDTGYDIKQSTPILPVSLNPNDSQTAVITLVPHTTLSLHITVVSLGTPVEGATVDIVKGEIEESLVTGPEGQVFFADLPEQGEYTVTISEPDHVTGTAIIDVQGTTRETIEINAN